MTDWQQFMGPNAGYVLEMYERFLQDPASVDEETRAFFARWQPPTTAEGLGVSAPPTLPAAATVRLVMAASRLAQAIRNYGHLAARLDPLGGTPPGDPALDPRAHGIAEEELVGLPADVIDGPIARTARNALEAVRALRRVYSSTSGYEFNHVTSAEERAWLYEAVESGRFSGEGGPIDERQLLERLTQVEALERYLHRTFPGQKRFSIEGTDLLVPMLDEAIGLAAEAGICEVVLGMAHRGRLNVLAHVLGKPYTEILTEFLGAVQSHGISPAEGSTAGYTGDVKYHHGGRKAYRSGDVVSILVTLAPNPSHLEFVNPVVEGMARASDEGRDLPGPPTFYDNAALPILVHGDAAFTGQGIVAETLNLSRLEGYRTSGTIHIIANNQLGFTAEPQEGRSTLYASDLAKGFEIPIIHASADDPRAAVAAVRLATAYRQRFRKDFLIDLIGYRRWGHNEGDEPAFTQPTMYEAIASQPTVRELWANDLIARGVVSPEEAEAMARMAYEQLQEARSTLERGEPGGNSHPTGSDTSLARPRTAVAANRLAGLNEDLCRLPDGFTPNVKLARVLQRRCAALGPEGRIDWGHAEMLAFASILAEGTPIRLTGQDTARGTFSQRHLVLHDQRTGAAYTPLQHISAARASFAVYNSPLSEDAALGFEYGYSASAPDALVLWEAQYGDFANAAQVIIDQFITSGRAKWEQKPALVLLLPHGLEGQGPEHSSARLERFLQMAAEDNVRIANCSTAAQYFHLLRWQAALLRKRPRPLVVMTPKSLLRLPEAAATLPALAEGTFHPVLDDQEARRRPEEITRLILCSGKVYYDLLGSPSRQSASQVAIARLELLHPLPVDDLTALLAAYPRLREVLWLQEEPQNMGAWTYVAPRLQEVAGSAVAIGYLGRPSRASPAEGSADWHALQQARIVETAFQGVARSPQSIREVKRAG